jgi:hypothetical protein
MIMRFFATADTSEAVMRGLDPRIHPLRKKALLQVMDCRVKPGNDERVP